MAELEPQAKGIRVSASTWAIANHIVKTGKTLFAHSELKNAACSSLDTALVDGLIEKLDNGMYRANIDLARLYARLLPKVHITGRKGRLRSSVSEAKIPCEEKQEAVRLAMAWTKLANWAEIHAEDEEEVPKDVLEVLNRHGIEVQRATLPGGAKVVLAKVLNYYIIMDWLMTKNSPKCVRFPQLGPEAMLCASTREKLYLYLTPLMLRT